MPQNIKTELRDGGRANGCWLELFNPLATEIIAQAGYDCVMIDLEHGPGSVLDLISIMQAIGGADCAPLVRVPANDPVWIKRVLDTGPAGVMVPAVNDAAEAEVAVAACRYAPRGVRGMAAPVVRASKYGAELKDYLSRVEDDLLIMCQIESPIAVENVTAIAKVEGVDMLFIGPFDLSASVGYLGEPDHAEVVSMIQKVETAAKDAGKLLGGIPTPGRDAKRLYAAGYDLVLADVDALLLRDSAQAGVQALLRAAGRSPGGTTS
ncbi:MAG: HpcH/HpaI aldolase/citrate lyase family protein [Acidiferrobacterales bacterium]